MNGKVDFGGIGTHNVNNRRKGTASKYFAQYANDPDSSPYLYLGYKDKKIMDLISAG